MACPKSLVHAIRDAFGIETFVETGTFRADTAVWASGLFAHVYTIERSPRLHADAEERFASHRNISFLLGDAREHLPTIRTIAERPALFWLDAHWSGGETAGECDECPLMEEIACINASGQEHFVFIDDARLFTAPPPKPHRVDQWPSLQAIVAALTSAPASRYLLIRKDVIVAVPMKARDFVVGRIRDEPAPNVLDAPLAEVAARLGSRLRHWAWTARRARPRSARQSDAP